MALIAPDTKWITRAVVVAPIFHISLCYYYLFLRSFGFGSNVSEFVAPGDVFTVGLSKLLSTYILFAFSLIFSYAWMDADPLKIVGRTEFVRHPDLERPTTQILFRLLPYVAALAMALSILINREVHLLVLVLITIPFLARLINAVIARNGFQEVWRVPVMMASIGLLNLTASAYGEGFKYRHESFQYYEASRAKCEDGTLVLFSSSDRYVAVTKKGERVLVTNECVKTLTFPSSKVVLGVI